MNQKDGKRERNGRGSHHLLACRRGLLLGALWLLTRSYAVTDETAAPAKAPAFRRQPAAISVHYTVENQARLSGDTAAGFDRISMHEAELQAGWPLYLGEDWRVFSGLGLHGYRFAFKGDAAPPAQDVYVIGVPVRVVTPAPEHWSFMLMLTPGIYSDLEHVTIHDLRYAFLGLAHYDYSEQLRLTGGLIYSRIFGSAMLLPAAGAVWNPHPAWQVNLTFPRPAVMYAPGARWRLAAAVAPSGNEWSIRHTGADGQTRDYELHFKGYRAGLGLEYRLHRHLLLRAAAGGVFLRRYELHGSGETMGKTSVNEAWFVQTGLALF